VTHNITSPRDPMANYGCFTSGFACLSRERREAWLQAIIKSGGVGERLKPAVLKTVGLERASGVRIPPPPPACQRTAVLVSPLAARQQNRARFCVRVGNFSFKNTRKLSQVL